MNLHDPQRPKIFQNPAFCSGMHAIPKLQVWPQESGKIEISLMLPVFNQRFIGKWYSKEILPEELPEITKKFYHNPEEFIRETFDLDMDNLTKAPKQEGRGQRTRITLTSTSNPIILSPEAFVE